MLGHDLEPLHPVGRGVDRVPDVEERRGEDVRQAVLVVDDYDGLHHGRSPRTARGEMVVTWRIAA